MLSLLLEKFRPHELGININVSRLERVEILLYIARIVTALIFGSIVYHYKENFNTLIAPSFISGILIAFIGFNLILIILNILSLTLTSFREVKTNLTDNIAYLLFIIWIFVNGQTEESIIMLYGAGFFFFILTCSSINRHLYFGLFKHIQIIKSIPSNNIADIKRHG